MLEVGGGKPLMKKKESGGSMKDALKRRFTVHKPQFTSDVVDAFEKIKSFSRGGYDSTDCKSSCTSCSFAPLISFVLWKCLIPS
jgi:hypothetical protein